MPESEEERGEDLYGLCFGFRREKPIAIKLTPPTPIATGLSQLLFLSQNVSLVGGVSGVVVETEFAAVPDVVVTALFCGTTLLSGSSIEVSFTGARALLDEES